MSESTLQELARALHGLYDAKHKPFRFKANKSGPALVNLADDAIAEKLHSYLEPFGLVLIELPKNEWAVAKPDDIGTDDLILL